MKMPNLVSLTARTALGLLVVTQVASTQSFAQSARARERANENARFNRDDRDRDYKNDRDYRSDRDSRSDRDRDYRNDSSRNWMSDNDFVTEAYGRGLAELRFAHMAVDTSRDPDVQKIGHRIINEQQRANDDLKKIAESKGLTLPKEMSQRDQSTYDRLTKLQGTEFDRAYRDHLNTEYKHTIQLFERAADRAQDSQVRSVASQYANLFEQHAETIGITGLRGTSGTAGTAGTASTDSYRNDSYRNDSYRDRDRDRGYVRDRDAAASSAAPLSTADKQFVDSMFLSSRSETRAAEYALKNSKDQQVKTMAQSIITDHRDMERDLRDLASRKNVTLPRALSEGQHTSMEDLSKLNGNEFDSRYHKFLMTSHQNAVNELTRAQSSSDPDVRNFASKYLSVVKQHMQTAQRTGAGSNK